MNYYQLQRKKWDDTHFYKTADLIGTPKTYPYVTAKHISNEYVKYVLKEGIWNQNTLLKNLPFLNYFSCIDVNGKENYDWIILDVYYLTGSEVSIPTGQGFLCSPKMKNILSQFTLGADFHFYPALLKYQGEFLEYFLFQYVNNSRQDVLWEKSEIKIDGLELKKITSDIFSKNYRQFNYKKTIQKFEAKLTFKKFTDIMRTPVINLPIVSEQLKEVLEKENITGIKFNQSTFLEFDFIDD